MRASFGSASIRARSSSLSSKSKTSKFSTRRSWLDAFGIAQTCGVSSSQRSATWPAVFPCASPISRSVGVLRDLAAGERGVGGDHEVLLAPRARRARPGPGTGGTRPGRRRPARRSAPRAAAFREVRDPEVHDQPVVAQPDQRAERLLERERRGFGQCRSSRSRPSALEVPERVLRRTRRSSGAYSSRQIFVVRKNSLRGTPAAAIPRPTSLLVAVGARGVDVPVADRERVLDRFLALSALRSARCRSPSLGTVVPWISRARMDASIVVIRHPYPSPPAC